MREFNKEFKPRPVCHNGRNDVITPKPVTSWEEAVTNLKSVMQSPAFAYLTQQDQVVLGRWDGNEFSWPGNMQIDTDYLIELSVFNIDKEWRILRTPEGSLHIRLLEDVSSDIELSRGVECCYLNQQYLLYGTIFNAIDAKWTSASEDRGGTIKLPFTLPDGTDKTKRVWCAVRNYFTISDPKVFTSIGDNSKQEWAPSDSIIFTDYRLCGFITEDDKGNRKEVS